MHIATSQPYGAGALAMFGQHARGIDVGVVSPGFAACPGGRCGPKSGLAGLGDWFSDAVDSLHNGGVKVIDSLTGASAARDAQAAAVALAQAQAARDVGEAQANAEALRGAAPIIAAGLGVVGLGFIFMMTRKG